MQFNVYLTANKTLIADGKYNWHTIGTMYYIVSSTKARSFNISSLFFLWQTYHTFYLIKISQNEPTQVAAAYVTQIIKARVYNIEEQS